MRPLQNVFYKLSCTEQRREGVAAYLCYYLSTLSNKNNLNIYLAFGLSFYIRVCGGQIIYGTCGWGNVCVGVSLYLCPQKSMFLCVHDS